MRPRRWRCPRRQMCLPRRHRNRHPKYKQSKPRQPRRKRGGSDSQQQQNQTRTDEIPTRIEYNNSAKQLLSQLRKNSDESTVNQNDEQTDKINNELNAVTNCVNSGGTWKNNQCKCPRGKPDSENKCVYNNPKKQNEQDNCRANNDIWNTDTQKCEKSIEHIGCENSGGTWSNGSCNCNMAHADFSRSKNTCECATGYTKYYSRCVSNTMYSEIQNCEKQTDKMWDIKTDKCVNQPKIKTGIDAINAIRSGQSILK